MTYVLIALNVFVYLLQWVTNQGIFNYLAYTGSLTASEPWRMVTSAFVHSPSSVLHIVFNMYSLFIFGPMLEQLVGRARYLTLYLLAAFGGSLGVLLLAPDSVVVGASGAIFGLLGAYFVIARRLGGNTMQLVLVIGLNLVIGFVIPNVAWQAHLGGLVVGAAVALILVSTRRRNQRTVQIASLAGVAAVLIAITAVAASA